MTFTPSTTGTLLATTFVYDGPGGTWTLTGGILYIYDGNRVVQERDTNSTPLVSYTRGNDLSQTLEGAGGIGGLLARSDGYSSGNFMNNYYYHADGNGSPREIYGNERLDRVAAFTFPGSRSAIDGLSHGEIITYLESSSQTLAASYRYDAFGNTLSSSGTLAGANTYRFSSKEFITNGSFYYYLYRFYCPSLQRWMNRDPVEDIAFIILVHRMTLDGTIGPNAYTFVANNSAGNIDPNGLTLYYCTVPTTSLPTLGIGRHGYLWNDATGDECGQESSCGTGPTQSNNGGDGDKDTNRHRRGRVCSQIDGTQGTDSANNALMNWCHDHADDGVWFPFAHDCHNVVNKCLKHGGLPPITFPGRFGPQPIFSPLPKMSSSTR